VVRVTDEDVLVSTGHHTATRYHRQLGDTKFSVCVRLEPGDDPELIDQDDAEARDLKPCSLCRFPDDGDRRVVADGGESRAE
jgi:hypothetical protein